MCLFLGASTSKPLPTFDPGVLAFPVGRQVPPGA